MPCVICDDLISHEMVMILDHNSALKSIRSSHERCVVNLFGAISFFHIAKTSDAPCYDCGKPCLDNFISFVEDGENIPYVVKLHKECLISLGGKKTLDLLTKLK